MPGRGPQTFKKRQKEQERKERQQEKFAKRLARKAERANGTVSEDNESTDQGDDSLLDETERESESESVEPPLGV